ncbi:hypothetical protein ACFO1B_03830 [Dactylosporangium siamense]|uniref:Uncharacterized protein n=1 Tax=Dactylosporangium siamense TaxID=685454 RepID=A0A919U621_9ACTN|nr:hypothetical protein [Dactylosporangium siamense]GIG42987.1 hypothetical protein Dsi01nite_010280 [Dactylosporangium siamense]
MIKTLRDQLAKDLDVLGVPVANGWPDRITPPVLLVVPPASAVHVTAGPNFTEYTVALDVVVLAGKASPALALNALEELVEGVLSNTVDWSLSGVDSPSLVTISGTEYLGTVVHLSKPTRL